MNNSNDQEPPEEKPASRAGCYEIKLKHDEQGYHFSSSILEDFTDDQKRILADRSLTKFSRILLDVSLLAPVDVQAEIKTIDARLKKTGFVSRPVNPDFERAYATSGTENCNIHNPNKTP